MSRSSEHTVTPTSKRRRRWFALLAAGILGVVALGAAAIPVPYEAVVPGSTLDVAKLVVVPSPSRHLHAGRISMVDVRLVPLNALDYLYFRLHSATQVLPTDEIQGGESSATYDEQGRLDMAMAEASATYVALRQLGYRVGVAPVAVAVYTVNAPPATSRPFGAGDLVVSVDGRPTASIGALRRALRPLRPGEVALLGVRRFGSQRLRTVRFRLGAKTTGASGAGCTGAPVPRSLRSAPACLGVQVVELDRVTGEPFPVDLNAEGIIGPSGGLAFTLGLMEVLGRNDLARGRSVAATGTIALDGSVGPVGAVAQKTVAVRDAGADVFFVPRADYGAAKRNAGATLHVVPVTSIGQAVQYLRHLGR